MKIIINNRMKTTPKVLNTGFMPVVRLLNTKTTFIISVVRAASEFMIAWYLYYEK